ncbi:MAG: bifunctional DNA-formamidopyrimidine glycosylase/DNA-(apurinic or apyrimidinic site) lyase [Pelagibacterales bacterium]|nr:bifunctional DNA-formamidopyrimidine glycosylase/DNA-(apurinic or apyrimidinic site) lyase [Pelagibacterales bacterium]
MPELPEVETIRLGLQNLVNKKVSHIFRSDKKMRIESTENLDKIANSTITEISRRARYLIVNFSNDYSLIIHLGMSGRITVNKKFQQLKHDHFACELNDNLWLIFNDPRRFGFVDLVLNKNISKHKMLSKLGFEPLSEEFNAAYLTQVLKNKKMNIKTTMMDNEIVVGVGNIYINESLFDSKISPMRQANSLTKTEIKNLVSSIKKTIAKAIELGGSSINDYVNSEGNLGNFQNSFKVYGQESEKCLLCKNLIRKIRQNGRSSFYCEKCQK